MNTKKTLIEILLVIVFHNISLLLLNRIFPDFGGVISTILTACFLYWRLTSNGESLKDIGIARPKNLTLAGVIAVANIPVAMTFSVLTAVILRNYGITSAPPDIARFTGIQGNVPLYASWMVMALLASSSEEIIYRGFMISRLEKVLGRSGVSMVLILLMQAAYFGVRHYYQGLVQAYAAGAIGLVFGISYMLTKRNLWPAMIAHTAMNLISLTGRFLG